MSTTDTKTVKKVEKKPAQKIRLFARAIITGYRRSLKRQYRHTSIVHIEGLKERKDASFYLGKRVAYVTKKANKTKKSIATLGGRRVQWGKIIKVHGNSGAVKVKFSPQLPPTSIGKAARVFLYPSTI
jgi:large subunit ribosomal protein L35Ae